jgi:hypothetical protein
VKYEKNSLLFILLSMLEYITKDEELTDKHLSEYKEMKNYLKSIIGHYIYA